MFALFERLLRPTAISETAEPPAGLIAFYWHFARQAKAAVRRAVRRRLHRRRARHDGADLPRPRRHARHRCRPEDAVRRLRPHAARHGAGAAGAAPARDHDAEPARQPGDRRQRVEPHPLAEPLACGAAILGVLPERLRRPHRQPRDADRTCDPRDRRRADHRRLVHPGLRHQRRAAARHREPVARASGHAVVRRLSRAAAPVRAAHARPLEGDVGIALAAHRPHRRQLHQHPDREAVRPRARGRRLCARSAGAAHRPLPPLAAAQHAVLVQPDHAQRRPRHRHGRHRDPAVDAGARRGRRRRDGDPADLADRQRGRLGRLPDHLDLREHRRGAGRHDDDRAADRAHRCAGRRRR